MTPNELPLPPGPPVTVAVDRVPRPLHHAQVGVPRDVYRVTVSYYGTVILVREDHAPLMALRQAYRLLRQLATAVEMAGSKYAQMGTGEG